MRSSSSARDADGSGAAARLRRAKLDAASLDGHDPSAAEISPGA